MSWKEELGIIDVPGKLVLKTALETESSEYLLQNMAYRIESSDTQI